MNKAPHRRSVIKGLAFGGAVMGLPGLARAQPASSAPAVKVVAVKTLTRDFATIEFVFDGVASLLVRLPEAPVDQKRALAITVGDQQMYLSAFTRVCTHLGCQPALPDARSHLQVCPCHGSTYTADGTVVKGPANRNLALLTLEVRGEDVYAVALAPTPAR